MGDADEKLDKDLGAMERDGHGLVCPFLTASFPVPRPSMIPGKVQMGIMSNFVPCIQKRCAVWRVSEGFCGLRGE